MSMEQDASLDSANEYFKHLGKLTQECDRAQTAKLWALAKKGNEQAKNKILEMNLRLVVPTAKRFLRPGMELMDLVEEGNLGLLQAIQKFDPAKGYRFSTYAVYWIEQYIRKYIEEQSGFIKIPSHAWGNLKRWFRAWNELKAANGRDPSLQEMAQELDLTARQVQSIMDTLLAAKGVDSLTAVIFDDDEVTLEEVISDDGKGNPHDVFLRQEDQNSIKQSMSDLSDRDRQIVIMRYGLDDNEPRTLGEVADALGLSRERVRQIEMRAIGLLRREARRAGILETSEENHRTRNLHSGLRGRMKTNILGEEVLPTALARLLQKNKRLIKQEQKKSARAREQKKKALSKRVRSAKPISKKSRTGTVSKNKRPTGKRALRAGAKKTSAIRVSGKKAVSKKARKSAKK